MKKLFILLSLMLLSAVAFPQKMKESYYQNGFAIIMKGQKEVILDDDARVDIVTDTFAIEVDFAAKWAESIGQSLYYSACLGRKAGVLLLVNGRKEDRYVRRLMRVATKFDITVWVMDYNTDIWKRVVVKTTYEY